MSTPIWSFFGKVIPQSIRTMRSPLSTTYMFLPISPAPPSGITRTLGLVAIWFSSSCRRCGLRPRKDALALERAAEDLPLHRRRVDQGKSEAARGDQARHLEGRLDEDRTGGHEERDHQL